MRGAVCRRFECNSLVIYDRPYALDILSFAAPAGLTLLQNLPPPLPERLAQRKHLEPSRIRHCRTAPVHEGAQAAVFFDEARSRLKVQMISVPENNFRTGIFHLFRGKRLDRRFRSDDGECRRPYNAVWCFQDSRACKNLPRFFLNSKTHVPSTLSGGKGLEK